MDQMISQDLKLVPMFWSANINAGDDSDSVDMRGVKSATCLIMCVTNTGAAGVILNRYSGVTDGSKATALTFNYKYGGAAVKATSADVFTAVASSAALQIATATLAGRGLIIEINADQIPEGHRYLTIEIGAESDTGIWTIWGLLDPMFMDPSLDTVVG